MSKTMYEKIWDAHLVRQSQGDTSILYVDLHLVHEVTSPQAMARYFRCKLCIRNQQY